LPLHKYLTESGERRVSVNPEGKASHTVFRLLARWPEMSLLEAQLKTGRTHQIRVHLAHLGFPILGDEKYGDFALNKSLSAHRTETDGAARLAHGFQASADGGAAGMHRALPDGLASYIAAVDRQKTREFSADNLEQILGKLL
jgi:23S rRNA pseudouridine955/2504/2580 synthase